MISIQDDPKLLNQLREAAVWRLLSLLLERPRRGRIGEMEDLAREVGFPPLLRAVESAKAADEGVYLALLGPGGMVSPREVAYRGLIDPAVILQDLGQKYQAFRYSPATEDPIDHLAVETGFLGYLTLKQAYATQRADEEALEITRQCRRDMIAQHLKGFAEPVARKLREIGGGHLTMATRLLVDLLEPVELS